VKKKPKETWRVDEINGYCIRRQCCPTCGRFLASYTFGHDWTENGVHPEQMRDCRGCGQAIDWSAVPKRPSLLRRE
jgi:hypothetical protein